jgi:hypothetical protein
MAVIARTASGTGASQDKNGVKSVAVSSGNVSNGDSLEVESTVVDDTELRRRKRFGRKGNIHEKLVMFTFGRRDEWVVDLDLSINLRQKLPGALQEDRFEMRDGKRRKHHERDTNARIHLRPRQAAPEEGANISSGAPVLDEIGNLTFALECRELNKSGATQRQRAIPDCERHFSVEAALCGESLLCFGLDFLELSRGKVTLRQNVRKFRQEDRIIHHPRFQGGKV